MRTGLHAPFHFACIALQFILLVWPAEYSPAAEFTVNSNQDAGDLEPGNGLCVAYIIVFPPFVLPFCTLRGAFEETNALPGPDIINIPSGNYLLDLGGINEDKASTGDLDITDSLNIRGKGVDQTSVDGNGLDRVFDILNINTNVTIEHLSIINGILPASLTTEQKGGGGIRNRGNLTLRNIVLSGHRVNGSTPEDAGGALLNLAQCTVVDSTIMNNHAATGGGIRNRHGGNLFVFSSTIHANDSFSGGGVSNNGWAKIVNATISGNSSTTGNDPHGGGIYNTSIMKILQSTITDNSSQGQGGGVSNEGSIEIANTIIARNTNTNCHLPQPLDSLGNNLDDGDSCLLNTPSDIINADPKLDGLYDHGGPTLTHSLLIGSPAVDKGQDLTWIRITKDQRGIQRPLGDAFDIGAFETRKRSVLPPISHLLCGERNQ